MFLDQQISILKLFLKAHVTLKTGVANDAKNSALPSQEYILKCNLFKELFEIKMQIQYIYIFFIYLFGLGYHRHKSQAEKELQKCL